MKESRDNQDGGNLVKERIEVDVVYAKWACDAKKEGTR